MVVRRVDVAAVMVGLGVSGCGYVCDGTAEAIEQVELSEDEYESWAGEDGALSTDECERLCSESRFIRVDSCSEPERREYTQPAIEDTGVEVRYAVICEGARPGLCGGRRPPALARLPRHDRVAALEAASIHAFLRLHRELELHGAPSSLRHRCLAAARDEVRHARLLSSDGRVPRVHVGRRPLRSLAAIARDNAIEGCVHETWGALVARLDPRPVYRVIAADELRHAQLAWDIEEWLGPHARPDLRRRAGARLVARTEGPLRPWAEAMRERLWV